MSETTESPTQDVLRAVSALAVIKVNWDDNQDYIANFVPIVGHCIRLGEHDAISPTDTQALIHEIFGLRIPQGPLQTILHRMSREGILSRRHGVYYREASVLERFDLGAERESVLRQHAHLIGLLVDYAARLGRDWDEAQAERALLGYVEVLAEPILGAVVAGEPVVDLPKIDSEGSVLTSRFVLDLCQKEPAAFEYLVTIVKGTMLANVLFLPEAFSGGRTRLTDVDVFLDTPIVLRALGYAEEPYRVPAEELLELLRQEGASLRIFEHTLHEVEGVLDGAAVTYRTGTQKDHFPGDVVDYFASEGFSRSDVEMDIAGLGDRLRENEIDIQETPEYTADLALDERDLEVALKEGVNYNRHGTMVKDLNSLTAIYRLRNGEPRRHIESCDAVVVTTNYRLAHISRVFFAKDFGHRAVPICMSDHALAAIVWLMNPAQAADLPRRQIIAISYAALNPPEDVWRKYLREIRRLRERGDLTEEQVGLLLFSPDARVELMSATSGDVDALASGTIAQILRHAEQAARAEVVEELERERARQAEIETKAASEVNRAATEAAEERLRSDRQADRFDQRAGQFAGLISWVFFAAGALFTVLACTAAAAGVFPSAWSRLIPLGSALAFLFGVGGVISFLTGWNLLMIRPRIAKYLKPRIARRLHAWFGPDGSP
jgi:hypothetical protein